MSYVAVIIATGVGYFFAVEYGIVQAVFAFGVSGLLLLKVIPAMWNSFRDPNYDQGGRPTDDGNPPWTP